MSDLADPLQSSFATVSIRIFSLSNQHIISIDISKSHLKMFSSIYLILNRFLLQFMALGFAFLVIQLMFVRILRQGGKRVLTVMQRDGRHPLIMDESYGKHRFVKLNDIILHYVDNNQQHKPIIVFLHGFLQCWHSWRHQLNTFGDKFRTVSVDLRGYGMSSKLRDVQSYSFDKIVEDIRLLLLDLRPKETKKNGMSTFPVRLTLVGYELGGFLCWMLASRYPSLMDQVVIIGAPHPYAYSRLLKRRPCLLLKSWFVIFSQIPLLPELYILSGDLDVIRKMHTCYRSNKCVLNEEELECYRNVFSKPGAVTHALNYFRANLLPKTPDCVHHSRPNNGKVNLPLLLIWGSKDAHFNQELIDESMKYAKKSQLQLITNAERFVHQDMPGLVNRCILQFVNQ